MHSTAAPLKAAFNSRADDQVILVGWQSQYGFPTTKQHIIPQQLTKEIQGFWPDYNQNATRNMMELPYNVDDAVVSGLAHQRGGHEPYSRSEPSPCCRKCAGDIRSGDRHGSWHGQ